MSAKRLGRGRGVVLTCDGPDCTERVSTGNVVLRHNRAYARDSHGWIRGGRGVRDRKDKSRDPDYCPICAVAELARVAELRAEAEKKRKARDEKRRITPKDVPSTAVQP